MLADALAAAQSRPAPVQRVPSEVIQALRAICEGYPGTITDGYVIVKNPKAAAETIAPAGVNPNLVIDCGAILAILAAPSPDAAAPPAESKQAPPVYGDEVSIRATYIANTRECALPLSDRAWVRIEGNEWLTDCLIAAIEKRGAPQDEWRPIKTAPTEKDITAKAAYDTYTANHPTIHSNRFPAWSELTEQAKDEWRAKVAAPAEKD